MMSPKDIKKENLIKIVGLESLSQEAQAEIINEAADVIETRCLNMVLEALDEKEKKQFVNALDKKEPEVIKEFLKEKNINLMDILKKEVLQFKTEMAQRLQR